ncbi:hypothetical protein AV530_014932 [Patagioenas fasciata monilis]|uniref:Uncharacterized protein n=1 Tax=Patagioenas fasciata monilis TaxID=372326 RepID=A0A1V4K0C4_PATFA|nr:hypothetical protein AV530_014932 [Patagioenas fasciata monilis]
MNGWIGCLRMGRLSSQRVVNGTCLLSLLRGWPREAASPAGSAAGAEVLDKWQQKADICIGVIVSLSGISNVWNMLHKLATSFQWVKELSWEAAEH